LGKADRQDGSAVKTGSVSDLPSGRFVAIRTDYHYSSFIKTIEKRLYSQQILVVEGRQL
jgi:hypothetical protein